MGDREAVTSPGTHPAGRCSRGTPLLGHRQRRPAPTCPMTGLDSERPSSNLSALQMDFQFETVVGEFAGIDFGGRGPDVLLIHGTGHNSAAWIPVAERLRSHCRLVAIDLRGHGRTPLDSREAEQYWRDLGLVCDAGVASAELGWPFDRWLRGDGGSRCWTDRTSRLVHPGRFCARHPCCCPTGSHGRRLVTPTPPLS